MTFRLSIPGRDDPQTASSANSANPLIDRSPISGLAELATVAEAPAAGTLVSISGIAELAPLTCAATATGTNLSALPRSFDQSVYTHCIVMLPPDVAAAVENERFARRHARIVWMGYIEPADRLAEILTARDRRIDDRRLCVECAHAGPNWNCRKKQGFLTDVLQRCKSFEEPS